ncbi:MAG TPA: hypothetical protein EYF98_00195 [Planctomycetes bacterium]|nr:hypothetical protein [Planctomycetota bacterium]
MTIAVVLPVLGWLVLASPSEAQEPGPTDGELQGIWEKLPGEARQEVSQWYQAEITAARTYQSQLVAYVLKAVEHDPRDWPRAASAPPLYEASVHAPAQVIRRKFVARPSRSQETWIKRVFRARATEPVPPAWAYDYAQGTVVALGRERLVSPGPTHIFELALAGRVPDSDLAQAIVAARLDKGGQRVAHRAFAHAYSDRAGKALREVTLYDVWGSGLEMEMPDVECLGVVHDVLGDWKSWVAPVPPTQHDALYARIAEVYLDLRAEREMGQALAATYLQAEPPLAATYLAHRGRLHALWAQVGCDPSVLVGEIPTTDEGLEEFWITRGKALDSDLTLWQAGGVRRAALAADAIKVRETLVWVMRQLELLPGE